MSLIYNNKEVPAIVPVHDWHEHGLMFSDAQEHNRVRRQAPWLLVMHWTGGEGDHERVHQTLIKRNYGIHFYIEYDGAVYQYCDPAHLVCAHAGYVNEFSIGVEIQNRGFPPGRIQYPRTGYTDIINGVRRRMFQFTEAQIHSALALAEVFVALGVIERRVPRNPQLSADTCGSLLRETMEQQDVERFSGVVGHYHISRQKVDPGTDLLEAFIAAGY